MKIEQEVLENSPYRDNKNSPWGCPCFECKIGYPSHCLWGNYQQYVHLREELKYHFSIISKAVLDKDPEMRMDESLNNFALWILDTETFDKEKGAKLYKNFLNTYKGFAFVDEKPDNAKMVISKFFERYL